MKRSQESLQSRHQVLRPVFIISLPRSGSTLLQRLLMGHSEIDSCGEPWLALPVVYMLRKKGVLTDYGHQSACASIQDFVKNLDGGEKQYYEIAGEFLRKLYQARSSEGISYFVDKTPRYYKILAELRVMFPNASVMILVRNPLSVFSSMLNFVGGGLSHMPMWKSDWVEGHALISDALKNSAGQMVSYETLVADPYKLVKSLMDMLQLDFMPEQVELVSGQQLSRGDPTGVDCYQKVDEGPLSSWKVSINTPTKKRLALRWLSLVPEDVWMQFGYSRTETLNELLLHKPDKRWSLTEEFSLLIGRVYFYFGFHLLKKIFTRNQFGFRSFFN